MALVGFKIVKKPCYFCNAPQIVEFNTDFYFCPQCTAIYAFQAHAVKCEHIKDAPILYRHPWSSEETDRPFIYVSPLDTQMHHCSECDEPKDQP